MARLTDELLLSVLRDSRGKPLGLQEIGTRGGLSPGARTELKRRLRELVQTGRVAKDAKRYLLPPSLGPEPSAELRAASRSHASAPASSAAAADLLHGFRSEPKGSRKGPKRIVGVLQKKPQGFGFIVPLGAGDGDLFLPASEAKEARDGDLVQAEVVPGRGGRSAGRNAVVVERRRTHAVGIYRVRGSSASVEPLDGEPAFVTVARHPRARDGEAVRVRLPERPREPGEVEALLGDAAAPGLEGLSEAYARGFSDTFPAEVLAEVAPLPTGITAREREGREDLTALPLCTIDGEDARDFDDAVFVEAVAGGDRLVVAIADVSHYVRSGTALDIEALRKGTSLYLPDRVLPMLPERLSNDLCSLRPDEDRLCLCADLVIDGEGRTVSARLYPAVMRSAARCTYTQVAASLEGAAVALPARVTDRFSRMAQLAERLTAMRRRRGAIDFNLPEAKVVLDAEGNVTDLARRPRNAAHRLVEEFMLAANEAVASSFSDAGLPTIFRVHDSPDVERLAEFAALARAHGFEVVPGDEIRPQALDTFLRRIQGHPEERALNNLLLRAMMQALYSAENLGHYGLGARSYLHFTSPIRRYPDLCVHRLLRQRWEAGGPAKRVFAAPEELEAVARRCSERERAAMGVERETVAFYGALLMRDHVGELFEGTIDAAVDAGIFVELERYLVSGLVPAADLGAGALLDREHQRWVVPGSGRAYRMGGKLRVVVASVNLARRQIDLALADPVASVPGRGGAVTRERPAGGKRIGHGR